MTPNTAIVLQARMGSTRLPGKVLARIGTRTLLEHCVRRLSESALPVIVATTTREEDDAIEREARRLGAEVFRGPEHDVLARYIEAGHAFGLTELVRATADNPFVDGEAPRRVVRLARVVGADHLVECGLPVGAAVELVKLDALERARDLITDPYDREHVTSFLRRDARFRALRAVAPGHLRRPGLRLTVDTEDDLEFARAVMAMDEDASRLPRLAEVIRIAETLHVRAVAAGRVKQGA